MAMVAITNRVVSTGLERIQKVTEYWQRRCMGIGQQCRLPLCKYFSTQMLWVERHMSLADFS